MTTIPRTRVLGHGVQVEAIGARTPVGLNAVESCASMRAGLARLGEHPMFFPSVRAGEDGEPEPAIVAKAPDLSWDLDLEERLIRLGLSALQDLVTSASLGRGDLSRTALFVYGPRASANEYSPMPADEAAPKAADQAESASNRTNGAVCDGRSDPFTGSEGTALQGHARWSRAMLERAGLAASWSCVESARTDRAGLLAAVARSGEAIAEGKGDKAIVLVVDSWITPRRLRALDESWRLKSARNVDGFVPGEAAVALLVGLQESSRRKAMAHVTGLGSGREPRPFVEDRHSTGEGLVRAIRAAAIEGRAESACGAWILSDMNGESYRAHDLGLASSRLGGSLRPLRVHDHPADSTGDVGIASGALLIAAAARAFERRYAPSDEALVLVSSDDGERAALTLVGPGDAGGNLRWA